MIRRLLILFVLLSAMPTWASVYYVASSGSDSNDGLTPATAWLTVSHAATTATTAGDRILLHRGDSWNESLQPGASGTSSSPIIWGAYGRGAAPILDGSMAVGTWTNTSGNVWQASVTESGGVEYVTFDGLGGEHKTWDGTPATSLTAEYEWMHDASGNLLYVYSATNPGTAYTEVRAYNIRNVLMFSTARSYVTLEDIEVRRAGQRVVYLGGACSNIVLRRLRVWNDQRVSSPYFGIEVNNSGASAVTIEGCEIFGCYIGIQINGTNHTIRDCLVYGNRLRGINAVSGSVTGTVDYNMIYGNGSGLGDSGVSEVNWGGLTNGGHNISYDSYPWIEGAYRYNPVLIPAVDDVIAQYETWENDLVNATYTKRTPLSFGVISHNALTMNKTFIKWHAKGVDLVSHGWSSWRYTFPNCLTIHYVGTGSAATLTISGNNLTTNVTGGPGGENLSYDMTASAYDEIGELCAAINGVFSYTCTRYDNGSNGVINPAVHSDTQADVSAQDITTAYTTHLNINRYITDEIDSTETVLESAIPGLNVTFHVWPGNQHDDTVDGYIKAAGMIGSRTDSGDYGEQEWSQGINPFSIYGISISYLTGKTLVERKAEARRLAFFSGVLGIPVSVYTHPQDGLTAQETADFFNEICRYATCLTYSELMTRLTSQGTATYGGRYAQAAEYTPTPIPTYASPTRDAGSGSTAFPALDGRETSVGAFDIGPLEWAPRGR